MKLTSGIRDINKNLPHNLSKRNWPVIIQRHIFLATSNISKKKFQLIVEEYDKEALSYDEANNVRKLLKGGNLISSNIAILAE